MRQIIQAHKEDTNQPLLFNEDCIYTTRRFSKKSIDLIYADPPFYTGRVFSKNNLSFTDDWNSLDEYLNWIKPRLSEFYRVLKETGTMYIHCDWHASHYIKVICDTIFGRRNFINEIIWKRHSTHNDTKQGSKHFGRIHDTILVYSKSPRYIWNQQYTPYDSEYIKKVYKYVEDGTKRRYALGDLSGPGGKSKGNPMFEFLGFTRYWRYNKNKMKKLLSENKIVQKGNNVPKLKRYLDNMKGKAVQDIWTDINSKRNTKYPTQKPEKLLERIISTSSNPNNVVYDPFSGSSTSGIVSLRLARNWIGSEISSDACSLSIDRLKAINSNVKLLSQYNIQNESTFSMNLTVENYEAYLQNDED